MRSVDPDRINGVFVRMSSYRARLAVQVAFIVAALAVGVVAVFFSDLITWLQDFFAVAYGAHPYLMTLLAPGFFVAGTGVAVLLAPEACGSGIPQVLRAVGDSGLPQPPSGMKRLDRAVSVRTAAVKVISTVFGFLGGASIGGEGPIVQISASIFATVGTWVRKYIPQVSLQSFLVAGAGAGIASAFNTPLGGVVFALEEFAVQEFGEFKHLVLLGVIVAGLTTQAMVGDQLYLGQFFFGKSDILFLYWATVIGIVGGVMGGIFGRIVSWSWVLNLRVKWWVRALVCGVGVSLIAFVFSAKTSGSGYTLTRAFVEDKAGELPLMLPVAKLLATALSTISGVGGGILAPSLSIGAFLGKSAGAIASFANLKVCALLGMVAYFTGTFQIPMTAVIIVMEMTNEHGLILPMMIAGLFAYGVSKLLMPKSLYGRLVQDILDKEKKPEPQAPA